MRDSPLSIAFFDVTVFVEGRALDREPEGFVNDSVFEGPGSGRFGFAYQIDLRMMNRMARQDLGAPEAAHEKVDDGFASVGAVLPAAVARGCIFGEASFYFFPEF